ncbi:MAG: hypothetical protein U0003_05550 [Vampirovibrionales bacterium]
MTAASSTSFTSRNLTRAGWQTLQRHDDTLPHWEALSRWGDLERLSHGLGRPWRRKGMGWLAVNDHGEPEAGLWGMVEREHQWQLVWAAPPGSAAAVEALLRHAMPCAQQRQITHWTTRVPPNHTVLAAGLKSHGFRHIATQTVWHGAPVLDDVLAVTPPLPTIRPLQSVDKTLLRLALQEMCPVHARPYLSPPGPLPWWQTVQHVAAWFLRGVAGVFFKQWVLPSPGASSTSESSHPLVAWAALTSSNYQQFDMGLSVHPAWDELTEGLVWFVLRQACQQTATPTLTCVTYAHQQGLETSLTHWGFERLRTDWVLARDVWAPIKPARDRGFMEGWLPLDDPLLGAAKPTSAQPTRLRR